MYEDICTYDKEQTTLAVQILKRESPILPAVSTLTSLFVMCLQFLNFGHLHLVESTAM